MSKPARSDPPAPDKPVEYVVPEDAFTPAERELLARRETDPVDVEAALRWLNGEGPDPWRAESS